jgi:hypothetical protein
MALVINRASGGTPSEKLLAELADHTFLDLWSWPNVYKEPGKELCDLLVVCGDDVVLFSDKSVDWPSGTTEVAWPRWYRRAIGKSVDQIRGAARWMRNNPSEIYADAKCQQRVPIDLPASPRRRVHGLCIALGAEKAASTYFHDPDGTFVIIPHLKGGSHFDFNAKGHLPFAIGDVDPDGPFVHVFNQLTLSLVMQELDTITDFTRYLTAREELIRSGRFMLSPSEMEMLANYLLVFRDGQRSFPRPEDVGAPADMGMQFAQGEYSALLTSPEYKRRQEANRESYAWDQAIKSFTENVLHGTQYRVLDVDPEIRLAERALLFMAREDRLRRRALGHSLVGATLAQQQQNAPRFARIAMPNAGSTDPALAYVFLVFARGRDNSEHYRKVRASILETYCLAILHDHRELKRCVGLAVNAISDKESSEDLIALEQLDWTTDELESFRQARTYYEILLEPTSLTRSSFVVEDFPPDPALLGLSRQQRRAMERALRKRERRNTGRPR